MGKPSRSKSSAQQSDNAEAAKNQDGDQRDDSETVTLATLKQMMEVQESMFRNMFDSVVSLLTTRVDDLVKTVAALKASIEFTQGEVADLKPVETKLRDAEKDIEVVKHSITLHKNKMEYMENQSRRNNIRINGVPEALDGETWESAESKAKEAIRENLGIEADIERAHRVQRKPRQQSSNQPDEPAQPAGPRTIVCRIRDWKQKEEILRNARRMKPEGLFISEDLAPETLESVYLI